MDMRFWIWPYSGVKFSYIDKMRNRVLADNSEWLSSEMKAFMQCKLQDANCKLSKQEKCIADIKSISPKLFVKNILGRR